MRAWCARPRVLVAALVAICAAVATVGPGAGATDGRAGIPIVANAALLGKLTATERAALARNGFVVTAPAPFRHSTDVQPNVPDPHNPQDSRHVSYWQFYDLYEDNYNREIPTFLTTDALLHTFHVIYDQTLVALERAVLAGKLELFSHGLMDVATYQYGATADPTVKAAARLNLGYVAVAERLLNPNSAPPAPVAPQVTRELALIAAHRGFAPSPLLGYAIDYSKFVPRGHYAGDETLRRYFQAMTWYGLLTFHLNGPNGALRTREALLLVRALTVRADLHALWASIFDPITTWVGRSDDLTARDYAAVMARVYTASAPVGVLADDALLARFRALANALRNPRINGEPQMPSKAAYPAEKGLRLFGQRFVADAAIMQSLIYDKVGTAQQPRVWPLGLDVAAALGSARATALVQGLYDQTRYAHYAQQLAALQDQYRTLPARTWQQNLYWSWLDTLRAVWGPAPPAAPAFMKNEAWADKSLATGLASWAELRHDTLLYVKQAGGGGGGGPPTIPPAYVEPVPLVYTRLLALAQQLKATLIAEGVLDSLPQTSDTIMPNEFLDLAPKGEQGYRAALDMFNSVVALAERVSERELQGLIVSRADMLAVATSYGPLAIVTDFFQLNGARKFLTFFDKQVAAIADVFTEPLSGRVLEVGVGDVLPLYAVVSINGQRWLARGGVYSYYEFRQPMNDRLTDDAWRHMSRRPGLPAWTAGYVAY